MIEFIDTILAITAAFVAGCFVTYFFAISIRKSLSSEIESILNKFSSKTEAIVTLFDAKTIRAETNYIEHIDILNKNSNITIQKLKLFNEYMLESNKVLDKRHELENEIIKLKNIIKRQEKKLNQKIDSC